MSSGFLESVAATEAQAAPIVFCSSPLAESSDSVLNRRALITFGVTSVEGQNKPATAPDSSRIGE